MPALNKGDLVLVTGASGFLAAHVVKTLLEHGMRVRATVRTPGKGEYLSELFANESFEYVIVENIASAGAFDIAVRDVGGVIHTASPFYNNAATLEELFEPAIKGTTGVLESILKSGQVKGEEGGVHKLDRGDLGYLTPDAASVWFCEDDWNAHSIKMCETSGQDADGRDKYRASKTLAEKAFWDAVKHSPVQLEGVTINPPLVLGPIIHQCDRSEQLNTSIATFYKWLDGQLGTTLEDFQSPAFSFVDVRDCARAHVLALLVPEAAGQRFITCNGSLTMYQYHRAAHGANPSLSVGPQQSIDDVKKAIQAAQDKCNVFPGDKATRVLDLSYTTPEDTLRDMAASLLRFLPSD